MKIFHFMLLLLIMLFIFGCSNQDNSSSQATAEHIEIKAASTDKSKNINYIRTTEKKMALTFNGLAPKETMKDILNELKKFNIKATFFVQGSRLAEDPNLVQEILDQGHTVHNNTLNHQLLDDVTYEQTYLEIELSNRIFREKLNYTPTFVRSRTGDPTENLEHAAAKLGMKVIGYSINPQDRNMQSANEIADYIQKYSTRGAIIQLNTYVNSEVISAISLIYENANKEGFQLTTVDDVISNSIQTKTAKEILGEDTLSISENINNVEPKFFYKKQTNKKEIALTFDDYASDASTTEILNVLDEYGIKCTFFLIGKAVEQNPNLAKLILESGHEVASHSYYHLDVTKMDSKELQADIVKADLVLTEALQEKPLRYFRPAKGLIDEKSAKAIAATGMDVIALYDVASFDWDKTLSAQDIYQRVKERTTPGSVIVMHVLDGTNTVDAMRLIIDDLLQQGYEFKLMSEWISEAY